MLKPVRRIGSSEIEAMAVAKLRELLRPVPFISVRELKAETSIGAGDWRPYFLLPVEAEGEPWVLVCEVKSDGEPRNVRAAALQVRDYALRWSAREANARSYPMVIAPFISPSSAEICKDAGVGFADLAGNCRLQFDRVYVEKRADENPFRKRRAQRSLFAPKSARILRLLLAQPNRAWKVAELAERAQVSLGQVSNLRQRLLGQEWASVQENGMRLSKPRELLDAWRQAYRLEPESTQSFYTLLHGEAMDKALRSAFAEAGGARRAMLASYSAARWLAPYARAGTLYLYADGRGEAALRKHLKLEAPGQGANVSLMRPKDEGVLLDAVEAANGVWCTSPIQTYLDLIVSGERGAEAAEHLFNERIAPRWKAGLAVEGRGS